MQLTYTRAHLVLPRSCLARLRQDIRRWQQETNKRYVYKYYYENCAERQLVARISLVEDLILCKLSCLNFHGNGFVI